MIRLIILLLFVYSGAAYSSSAEHSLLCKEPGQSSDSASLTLSFEEEVFFVNNTDRGCRSDYVVRQAQGAENESIIFSYPTSDDMGLNAQIMIFAAPANGGEAHYIGDIPAGASELKDGNYQDIQQAGDSIYENIYRIDGSKVITLMPGKELIISGEQCVYKKAGDAVCQKMRGSFEKPVCVLNDGARKILAVASDCTELKENL